MISRRTLLSQLGVIGAVGGGAFLLRERVIFAPPTLAFQGAGAWTPLSDRGGLVHIAGTVRGEPVDVVVDSGAQFSAIDRGLAERLGLAKGLPLPMLAFGVSGAPSLVRTVALDLELEGLQVAGLRAAAVELASLSAGTRQPFQLLLGRDVLKSAVLDADFPRGRMALRPPLAYAPPPGARAVPVRRRGGALTVEVVVESAAPIQALVDTGMTGHLALSADAAQAAGLLDPGRPVRAVRSVGLGGLSIDRLVRARSLEFAGVVIEDAPVQIFTPSLAAAIPPALVGVGLLQRFRMGLDLSRGRLDLTQST